MDEQRNVTTVGDLVLKRIRRLEYLPDRCKHRHMEIDDVGQIVMCLDCGKQVTPYWALLSLVEGIDDAWQEVHDARKQAAWDAQKHVNTNAARAIEATWRRRMAIICPHCNGGLLPEDRLGGNAVSRETELRRRAAEEEAQHE